MKIQTKKTHNESSSSQKKGGGIVFLKKIPGQTSFQALGQLKRVLETRKVGHTGTLDKFAEGLLIVLTGKFTRLNSLITDMDKSYEALIRFGRETDTLDPEGETVALASPPSRETIENHLSAFTGDLQQKPPLYSAVHIDGKRAHAIARSGNVVDMPSRNISIRSLEIVEYSSPDLKLRIHCSKGTYIRSLARDLGLACDSRAYVQELVRTSVGPFQLEDALDIEDFKGPEDFYSWEDFFKKIGHSCVAELSPEGLGKVKVGVPFKEEFLSEGLKREEHYLLLKDGQGRLCAVLERRNGQYRYKINLAVEQS